MALIYEAGIRIQKSVGTMGSAGSLVPKWPLIGSDASPHGNHDRISASLLTAWTCEKERRTISQEYRKAIVSWRDPSSACRGRREETRKIYMSRFIRIRARFERKPNDLGIYGAVVGCINLPMELGIRDKWTSVCASGGEV